MKRSFRFSHFKAKPRGTVENSLSAIFSDGVHVWCQKHGWSDEGTKAILYEGIWKPYDMWKIVLTNLCGCWMILSATSTMFRTKSRAIEYYWIHLCALAIRCRNKYVSEIEAEVKGQQLEATAVGVYDSRVSTSLSGSQRNCHVAEGQEREGQLIVDFEGALLPNLIGGKKVQASSVDGKCCRLQSV